MAEGDLTASTPAERQVVSPTVKTKIDSLNIGEATDDLIVTVNPSRDKRCVIVAVEREPAP